jgi:serine/threonine protein kinase
VILGNLYDEKCDIFSFGCLAYLLLSGQMLFEGKSNHEISILTEDNDYIERAIGKLVAPKGLKNLLRRLLETDPKKRISAR